MAPLVKHAFDAALLTDDPDAEAAGEVLPSHWRADHEITGVAEEVHTHTDLQPLDSDLTAIAALSTTSYGRALLALADAAAGRTALSLGSAAVASTSDFDSAGAASSAVSSHAGASDPHPTYTTAAELAAYAQPLDSDLTAIAALTTTSYGRSLLAAADAAALRTLAGAVIGTDVEAHDADLTTFAGLTPTNDDILQRKSGAWTNRTIAQLATDLALGSTYQPLDSDLTAIAALTTTSYGRSFLALADGSALGNSILPLTTKGDILVEQGGSNVSQGHTGSASSVGDSCIADWAFNGVEGTLSTGGVGWRSQNSTAGEWVSVDLGSAQSIGSIRVLLGTASNRQFAGFQLQYSDNNTTWTSVSGAAIGSWAQDTTLSITPITHRYWRILMGATTGFGGDVIEFQVFTALDAVRMGIGADGALLTADSTQAKGMKWALLAVKSLQIVASGGASDVATGVVAYLYVPYSGTIVGATLLASQSGSISIDVWKDTYANHPPTSGDKISASAPMAISSGTKSRDTTLTGWTKSVSAGDIIAFSVASVSGIKQVTISLEIQP